jgi:hypothetical protein
MPPGRAVGTQYPPVTPEQQAPLDAEVAAAAKAVAIVPRRPTRHREAPPRFEEWTEDVRQRARDLWAGAGGRNAAVTQQLLAAEAEGGAVPTASTIRRWAAAGEPQETWAAWADGELLRGGGQTLRQIQAAWLGSLLLSQETLALAMAGAFDGLPHGGISRVRAAEATLRVISQSGLLALLPDAPLPGKDDLAAMSAGEQSQHLRHHWAEEGERQNRRR